MAEDWIKMRMDLPEDPSVVGIASLLNMGTDEVCGRLLRVWSAFDRQTIDGFMSRYQRDNIDDIAHARGFADAMIRVGWLVIDEQGARMPNFENHNGTSAKKRACAQKRQRKLRAARHACVTLAALPDERREEESITPVRCASDDHRPPATSRRRNSGDSAWVDEFVADTGRAFGLTPDQLTEQRRSFAAVGWAVLDREPIQRATLRKAVLLCAERQRETNPRFAIKSWQAQVTEQLQQEPSNGRAAS